MFIVRFPAFALFMGDLVYTLASKLKSIEDQQNRHVKKPKFVNEKIESFKKIIGISMNPYILGFKKW